MLMIELCSQLSQSLLLIQRQEKIHLLLLIHMSSAFVSSIPDDIAMDKNCIPVEPHEKFPSKQYGSVNKSFQSSWYIDYPWLEYSVSKNCAYCFPCRFFSVHGDKTFIYTGYSNWKFARGKKGGLQVHHIKT